MAILAVIGWTLFVIAIIAGLMLDLVGLFGNWVILLAAGAAYAATGFAHWNVWILLLLGGLAVLGEVLESVAAGFGAARYGGGRGAIVASLIGSIAGAVFGTPLMPILGTLLGACAGAFAGAMLHEWLLMRQHPGLAMRTGFGAALGRVAGMFAKLIVGIAMVLFLVFTF